tara:strand:- start:318 stop:914 length:597 start_codon:yes stop_codon:yes gene_type:complete
MEYIIHRVNNLSKLSKIDKDYGVEIDVIYEKNQFLLKHSPFETSNELLSLEEFLKVYDNKKLIINVKTAGIEEKVINIAKKYLDNFLLLDVEFPFIVRNYKEYGKHLMLRVSKYENINDLNYFNKYIDWIWLDTYESFEFDKEFIDLLNLFNICLVSIERWDKNYNVSNFINEVNDLGLNIKAVMTEEKVVKDWEKFY